MTRTRSPRASPAASGGNAASNGLSVADEDLPDAACQRAGSMATAVLGAIEASEATGGDHWSKLGQLMQLMQQEKDTRKSSILEKKAQERRQRLADMQILTAQQSAAEEVIPASLY
jgi:hypothetical protein